MLLLILCSIFYGIAETYCSYAASGNVNTADNFYHILSSERSLIDTLAFCCCCCCRIHRRWQTGSCIGHAARGVSQQKMDVHLVGVGDRTNYVQVLGSMRGAKEIAYRQRGSVSISKHVSIGKCFRQTHVLPHKLWAKYTIKMV